MELGEIATRGAVDGRKIARDHQLAAGHRHHRLHTARLAHHGIESAVERTVGIEPRQQLACDTANTGEIAPGQHPTVGGDRHGQYTAIHARRQRGIQRAVRIQPGEVVAGSAMELPERAAEQNFSVGLHGHRLDFVAAVSAGVEGGIETAVGIEPHVPTDGRAIVGAQITTGVNFAAGRQGQGVDPVVGSAARIEGGVERAIRIEASDTIARRAIDGGEKAAEQEPAIGLHAQSAHFRGERRREARIERAIGVEPRQRVAAGSIVAAEPARRIDLAGARQRQGVDATVGAGAA